MSEIKIDWDKRNQPMTPEDFEKVRILQAKYNISDEEWNNNTPEQNNIISSTAPGTV